MKGKEKKKKKKKRKGKERESRIWGNERFRPQCISDRGQELQGTDCQLVDFYVEKK